MFECGRSLGVILYDIRKNICALQSSCVSLCHVVFSQMSGFILKALELFVFIFASVFLFDDISASRLSRLMENCLLCSTSLINVNTEYLPCQNIILASDRLF